MWAKLSTSRSDFAKRELKGERAARQSESSNDKERRGKAWARTARSGLAKQELNSGEQLSKRELKDKERLAEHERSGGRRAAKQSESSKTRRGSAKHATFVVVEREHVTNKLLQHQLAKHERDARVPDSAQESSSGSAAGSKVGWDKLGDVANSHTNRKQSGQA
jgi:hypothetical protein